MTLPFQPELIVDRIAWYEQARRENVRWANATTEPEERARFLQQAALAQAVIAGIEEAAIMVGVVVEQRL